MRRRDRCPSRPPCRSGTTRARSVRPPDRGGEGAEDRVRRRGPLAHVRRAGIRGQPRGAPAARARCRTRGRVLVVLDDTTVFPVVFLAAMRIGAIPVPVSPLDRADNFRHYVRDSYASLVVTDADRLETVRTALADEDVVYLARGAGGPGVVDLDAGMAAQDDRLDPGRDPPRRHGVLAVQLGVDGQAEGRRAPAARHRDHLRELRAQRPGAARRGRDVLDDEALSRVRAGQRHCTFPLLVRRDVGAACAAARRPTASSARCASARPTVFFSVPALYGALSRDASAEGALDSVRLCVSAAEALAPQIFDQWRERFAPRDHRRDRLDRDAAHLLLQPARCR